MKRLLFFEIVLEVTLFVAVGGKAEWIENPSNNHLYRLTDPLSWPDAEAQAVQWGGHLVTLDSWEEELWIKTVFGENEHLWIGFNDIEVEGTWVWSSGAPVTYTNWAPGEPNDCGGLEETGECLPEDGAVMNWCWVGGSVMDPCLGDYWNDLPIDGGSRGIVEKIVVPEIIITSPNEAEIWCAGKRYDITWYSQVTSGNVRIQYSDNGGEDWQTVIASTQDDGSYSWIVPNTHSEGCLVKICDIQDIDFCDQSDNPFTILPCQITVTSPKGKESWCVGEHHYITWTLQCTSGNVRIEYTTNGGLSWQTVITSTPGDGFYSWTVSNTPSVNCLVKVCDAEISDCCGSSNESFKISECGPLEVITESLQDGMEGCPYNERVTASGGVLPYSWYIVSGSGVLPPGLDLDTTTGTISGKPDSVDTFCFTLRVIDDEITFESMEYCVTIHSYDYEKGDANLDCATDILDVVFAVNIVLDLVEPTPDQNVCTDCNGPVGNCDGDGEVNILDAIKIVNLILGLDECP